MKNKENRQQLNNAGFSLVELLVAIVILAIIVVPLLNSFLSVTRTNAKARNTMNATAVAENVMEEFEAHSIEEISAIYTAKGFTVESDADLDGDGAVNTGAYRFSGRDTSTTTAAYEMEITLDPSAYAAINAEKLVDIQNLAGNLNAIYVESEADAIEAYGVFSAYAGGLTVNQIAGYVTKEINIEIESDRISLDLGGGEVVETDVYLVTANVFYQCDTSILDNGAPARHPQNSNAYVIFSNEDAVRAKAAEIKEKKEAGTPLTEEDVVVSKLANVVVCLQPRYDGRLDKVIVDNSDNVDCNLFLAKQEISAGEESRLSSGYPGMLNSMMTSYPVSFRLEEAASGWMSSSGTVFQSHCKLRTNLLENMKTTYEFYNVSNGSGTSGIAYRLPDAEEFQEGSGTTGGRLAAQIMQTDSLTPMSSENRMYDIDVKIYEDGSLGTDSPLITMTGTVTNN